MSTHKRGTVFRIPTTLDTIVRVYQDQPAPFTLPGMLVTTVPMHAVVEGVSITVWARVIRPE
jgi:hypothetical protein